MGLDESAPWRYSSVVWFDLANVISVEFPAICVQSNPRTDLGLIVNIGFWLKRSVSFAPPAFWTTRRSQ